MRAWAIGLAGLAGVLGAAGVGLAAVGAHKSGNPNVTTAAYFLLLHASALLGLCAVGGSRAILVAGSLMAGGVILFSGELAVHALTNGPVIPMAAPTGGLLMIAGWLAMAVSVPLTLARRR